MLRDRQLCAMIVMKAVVTFCHQSCRNCFFNIDESSKVIVNPPKLNISCPFFPVTVPVNPSKTATIPSKSSIHLVFLISNLTQVAYSVIASVVINMVDLFYRGLSVIVKPRQPRGRVVDSVNHYNNVPRWVFIASNRTLCTILSLFPCDNARSWVVLDDFLQFKLRETYLLHNRSIP